MTVATDVCDEKTVAPAVYFLTVLSSDASLGRREGAKYSEWRRLSLSRDAEAMRIAVVVGKDKLGLPIVSMFEF